jgi:hypothetical protein
VLKALLGVVAEDERSPLRGAAVEKICVSNGRVHLADAPSVGETFADIMIRHKLAEVTADGEASPKTEGATMAPSPAFAAHFAEVHIDRSLGLIRVKRVVSAVDGGRILNRKLAHSQVIGAVTMGIGMSLLEETAYDPTGRIANATLSDYLIPANADIHDLDVVFVGEPDRLRARGQGDRGNRDNWRFCRDCQCRFPCDGPALSIPTYQNRATSLASKWRRSANAAGRSGPNRIAAQEVRTDQRAGGVRGRRLAPRAMGEPHGAAPRRQIEPSSYMPPVMRRAPRPNVR